MPTASLDSLVQHLHRIATHADMDGPDEELLRAFARHRDQRAFATLLKRHGPMVYAVCRRVLNHAHDAEDAFQATFLVLARHARKIRKRTAVAAWLHGVAYHMALKARRSADRRRNHETRTAPPSSTDPQREAGWREVLGVLDEEIERLPARYREPFVLCCLQGLSRSEAARELGIKEGTVWSRLAEARKRLQQRLTRRGITLSALLAAAAVTSPAQSMVPPTLRAISLRAAVRMASGHAAKTVTSVSVLALIQGATAITASVGVKLAVICILAASAAAAGALAYQGSLPPALAASAARALASPQPSAEVSPAPPPRSHVDSLGGPLPAEAIQRLGTTRLRQGGLLDFVRFTPDGKHLVSRGYFDGIRVWDAATGKQLRSFATEQRYLGNGACLAPDGKQAAMAHGGTISLWDVQTGALRREFGKVQGGYTTLFSPDGRFLVTFGTTHNPNDRAHLELWDVASGTKHFSHSGPDVEIWTAVFTPDSKTLITGAKGAIRFWDIASGKQTRSITDITDIIDVTAISPNGTQLATVGLNELRFNMAAGYPAEPAVRIWDVPSGRLLRQIDIIPTPASPSSTRGPIGVVWTPDGKQLITAGPDSILRVWDGDTGKQLRRLTDQRVPGNHLAFSPDGTTLVVGLEGMRLLDFKSGKDRVHFAGHDRRISGLVLTPDDHTLISASGDGSMIVWDLVTGRECRRLQSDDRCITGICLSSDSRTLLTSSFDRTLRVWDLGTGHQIGSYQAAFEGTGRLLDLSPDGKMAALAGYPEAATVPGLDPRTSRVVHALGLVDARNGQEVRRLTGLDSAASGAAFSCDGSTLYVWTARYKVHIFDTATGKKQREFDMPIMPCHPESQFGYTAAISPDHTLMAQGLFDCLTVFELATGKKVREIKFGAAINPNVFSFSPDGRMLAWSSLVDPAIHITEGATGQERHAFHGHRGRISSLAFSHDGRTLFSGGEDTTILVWDVTGKSTASETTLPSAADLERAWNDLASQDAAGAYRAMQQLAAAGTDAVPFLAAHLKPVPLPDHRQLERWITDLDSSEFAVRARAADSLRHLDREAVPLYRQALARNPSPEARRQIQALLDAQFHADEHPTAVQLQKRRSIEVLEWIGTPAALRTLEQVAQSAHDDRLQDDARSSADRLSKRLAVRP